MDKEFKICQKTDFCFTTLKNNSITFMKTVDEIIRQKEGKSHEYFGVAHVC